MFLNEDNVYVCARGEVERGDSAITHFYIFHASFIFVRSTYSTEVGKSIQGICSILLSIAIPKNPRCRESRGIVTHREFPGV